MAIKQRKQLTGTTEQINAYAGVEGQLVWDKTKKKLVGMSGTAGTNYPMASESHTHSISNVTNLQSTLDGKQPKGDYATSKALTDGLAGKANKAHTHAVADVTNLQTTLDGKQPKGDYATTKALTEGLAGKANKAHTHAVADVTNLQTTLDGKIPKTGNRGALAGYSTSAVGTTVDASAKDSQYATSGAVTVKNGATGQAWTKVVKMSAGTVTLESNWAWVDGEAPELSFPCLLICHWNNDKGIAGIVKGAA